MTEPPGRSGAGPGTVALWRIAPIIAVDLGRPTAAAADLRALIGRRRPSPPRG